MSSQIFIVIGLTFLYVGSLNPALWVTASNLFVIVNGLATILLFLFIDPYLSMLTDDVVQGQISQIFFRRCIIILVISRLFGTLLAQVWLLPAAYLIVKVAEILEVILKGVTCPLNDVKRCYMSL